MTALLTGAAEGPTADEVGFSLVLTGLHNVVECDGAISMLLRGYART